MKTYSQAPDVDTCIENIRAQWHGDLKDVTISALFVFDVESTDAVLKHQGYPATAVARIVSLRDRASGMSDALIVVDRSTWMTLSARQRNALIDHELTHLECNVDKETGAMTYDALDRPKLQMRKHDHHFGWFDQIAERHGPASYEVRQARALMEQSGQLYFDFGTPGAGLAAVSSPPRKQVQDTAGKLN